MPQFPARFTIERVLDPSADEMAPPNSHVFDGGRAAAGARLNKFACSMKSPANRDAFKTDPHAYMTRCGLTDHEQALVDARDWQGMVTAGASVYALVKLLGSVGSNLVQAGLQMRGEDAASFRRSRPIAWRG